MTSMHDATARTRLLLVEDDRDNLDVFSMVLGERYSVFAYDSAAEAVQALDAVKPHVLVLDIGMHPVDGVDCLRAIRGTPGYAHVPAVALTGFAREVERRRFLERGFQAVVVKPVADHEKFLDLIDGLANSPAPLPSCNGTLPRWTGAVPISSAKQLDAQAAVTASKANGSGATERGPS